ncbi:hypothetical protein UPYG_G00204480 [Umbra pygmaea]|uniref:Reverse transcriptase domain-containing protein n=1 Tax=Umbra pygmaea TaxID=75934 RepID=A0ABD0X9F3_UMBPY
MQSCFRAGQGYTCATLKVLNDITTTIDKTQYCAAIFIDQAKALDSVNHHILIGRLNSLCFSNDQLRLAQIGFNVLNQRACCLDLWLSLWRCHRDRFLGQPLFSVYFNDVAFAAGDTAPPLRRRHHSNLPWPTIAAQMAKWLDCWFIHNCAKCCCVLGQGTLP